MSASQSSPFSGSCSVFQSSPTPPPSPSQSSPSRRDEFHRHQKLLKNLRLRELDRIRRQDRVTYCLKKHRKLVGKLYGISQRNPETEQFMEDLSQTLKAMYQSLDELESLQLQVEKLVETELE